MDINNKKITVFPEYEQPFSSFFQSSLNSLMWSKSELLSNIAEKETKEKVGNTRTVLGDGSYIDKKPAEIESSINIPYEVIINTDIDSFLELLNATADSAVESLLSQIFGLIGEVSEKSGLAVDARGKKFSYEMILELYQKLEISFDDDGNPLMPTLVVHPDMKKVLEDNPPTEEQLLKLNEIIEHKKGEYFAKKRSRKLY